MGGPGTPPVAEFCTAELGAVLGISAWTAQQLIADALDLRHRLPTLWSRVVAGEVKPWIARKTAHATRHLTAAVCAGVDAQITPYADRLTWTRLEPVIAVAWMRIDPDAATAADQVAREELGVWVSPSTDAGTKTMFVRAEAADMIRFDAAVDRCATSLELCGDTRTHDNRRAASLGYLADPQRAFDLYTDAAAAAGVDLELPATGPDPGRKRVDTKPPVTLYVHLTDHSLATGEGVARVEGIGPVIADRVRDWLTDSKVIVKPVIDLADQTPVDSYEIPPRLLAITTRLLVPGRPHRHPPRRPRSLTATRPVSPRQSEDSSP